MKAEANFSALLRAFFTDRLLRQRRAKAEFGDDPDNAEERPAAEVETYLQ